jgi:hypothetical protein
MMIRSSIIKPVFRKLLDTDTALLSCPFSLYLVSMELAETLPRQRRVSRQTSGTPSTLQPYLKARRYVTED